jgi:hypothetical protein
MEVLLPGEKKRPEKKAKADDGSWVIGYGEMAQGSSHDPSPMTPPLVPETLKP